MQRTSKSNHSLGYVLRICTIHFAKSLYNIMNSWFYWLLFLTFLEHFVGEITEERNQASFCPYHCGLLHSVVFSNTSNIIIFL